ncbi:hypothetical protein BDF20DRAFT_916337 [Mycotypha africana]|uniref:uncharacterized protein n=1 Tax=Mycotypha africana TaxID=64632 RepID=UPI002300F0C1|nr:uncharacterized protein BDF20DRAFT_916337 [Mycotypha africana]KAI8968902.1 hypothetical protein BDF20DRAFT_916337 [Mycotypha africana]
MNASKSLKKKAIGRKRKSTTSAYPTDYASIAAVTVYGRQSSAYEKPERYAPYDSTSPFESLYASSSSTISTDSTSSLQTNVTVVRPATDTWLPPISSLLCQQEQQRQSPSNYGSDYNAQDYYYCYPPAPINHYSAPYERGASTTSYVLNDTYPYNWSNNIIKTEPSISYHITSSQKKATNHTSSSSTSTTVSANPYWAQEKARPTKLNRNRYNCSYDGNQQQRIDAALPIIPFFFHHQQFGIEACMLQLDQQKKLQQQ